MNKLIKRFIVWYLLRRCNACLKYEGRVVRVFSKEFYDNEVAEYLNAIARTRHNVRENGGTNER